MNSGTAAIIVIDDDVPDLVKDYQAEEELSEAVNAERRLALGHVCSMLRVVKQFYTKHPKLYERLKRAREELDPMPDSDSSDINPPPPKRQRVDANVVLEYLVKSDAVLSPLNVNAPRK
jgi:hypothetical protein